MSDAQGLAVFVPDVQTAYNAITAKGFFDPGDVHQFNDLRAVVA
jgi:hypothetical protein